jgi:aminoglycoside phosphotransferase (APT) family kinase protein
VDEVLRRWVEDTTGAAMTAAERHLVGWSRDLWFIEVGGRSLVLRAETGAGALADTPLTLQREALVCGALAGSGVPVAEIVAVSEQPSAVLMTRLPGTSDLRKLAPADGPALVEHFMEALAALHRVDAETLDLPGLQRPERVEDHALHELALWEGIAAEHLLAPDLLLAEAVAWLRDHAPSRVARTVLVQGDTGPGNFLFEGSTVTGLVDWELSHLGDPMDDIAWLDVRGATGPFADLAVRNAAYERASGILIDAASVAYYRVFVFLRCAVITGIALARGVGTHGTEAYRAPHQRFLAHLADALSASGAPEVIPRSRR